MSRPTSSETTERDTASCNAGSEDGPAERETPVQGVSKLQSAPQPAITNGDVWRGRLEVALRYLTPPSIITDRPASLVELSRYAHRAGWTSRRTGAIRTAGIWWYRLIGLPVTAICRYAEWIWQRPGRTIPVALLIKLLALTTPGVWAVEHLIRPAAHLALWLFL